VAGVANDEPAVAYVNTFLQTTLDVAPVFMALLRCDAQTWQQEEPPPPPFADGVLFAHLHHFSQQRDWAQFWAQHDAVWQEAQAELAHIFQGSTLPAFLGRLTGQPLQKGVVIVPNLVYPALTAVLAPTSKALYLLLPPPKAVGESPPWPYREGPDWVLAETAHQLLRHLLQERLASLDEARQHLILQAAITLFLEEALGEDEAMAYMVRVKRQFKLPQLPIMIEALRKGLQAGRPLTID
jgi:hypothetical protein